MAKSKQDETSLHKVKALLASQKYVI